MALLAPLPGGRMTQPFGPSSMAVQPSMYYIGRESAWWSPYAGASFSENVHAGTDFAGQPAGTPLVAAEAGTVVRAEYDRYNGGGWVIEVEIRPGVRYSYNHCQSLLFGEGAEVARGQTIARVGATGTIWTGSGFVRSTYGVHAHVVMTIHDGTRAMLRNFADFLPGGKYAGHAKIRPEGGVVYPKRRIRAGVNLRSTPDLDVGATNIRYVNRADGLYNRTGVRWGTDAHAVWEQRGSTSNDDGVWRKLYRRGFGYLWVRADLTY